jgi:hypothetical protein
MRVAPAELASTARACSTGTRAPSRATPASARRRTSGLPASGLASRRRAIAYGPATVPSSVATARGSAAKPAGATSTSRRTRSGWRAASRIAMPPPIEWPTRSYGDGIPASSNPIARRSVTSSSAKPFPAAGEPP